MLEICTESPKNCNFLPRLLFSIHDATVNRVQSTQTFDGRRRAAVKDAMELVDAWRDVTVTSRQVRVMSLDGADAAS